MSRNSTKSLSSTLISIYLPNTTAHRAMVGFTNRSARFAQLVERGLRAEAGETTGWPEFDELMLRLPSLTPPAPTESQVETQFAQVEATLTSVNESVLSLANMLLGLVGSLETIKTGFPRTEDMRLQAVIGELTNLRDVMTARQAESAAQDRIERQAVIDAQTAAEEAERARQAEMQKKREELQELRLKSALAREQAALERRQTELEKRQKAERRAQAQAEERAAWDEVARENEELRRKRGGHPNYETAKTAIPD